MSGGSRKNLGVAGTLARNRRSGRLGRRGGGGALVLSDRPRFWGTLDLPDLRDGQEEVIFVS